MNTCSIDGCGRRHKARGYCATHYAQYFRGMPITEKIKTRDHTQFECCTEDGCNEPVKARGLCSAHYQHFLRHGHTKYHDRKKPPKICIIPGCDNHLYAHGLCHPHYTKERKWKEYGLTAAGYLDMLANQKGVCLICKKPEKIVDGGSRKRKDLAVDHCHRTNKIRGLLCSSCNTGIGLFCDDPSLLQSAMDYLKKHDDGASNPAKNRAE